MDWRGEATTGASGWDEHLLEPAWQLRNRSPELALLLATRLTGQLGTGGSRRAALVADAAAVVAAGRLGRGYGQVERAVRCVAEAEQAGVHDIEHAGRIELAGCARALNVGQSAALLLHATLGSAALNPAVRAAALAEVARWLARDGRQAELDRTVADADRLYAQDTDSTAPAGPARAALRAVLAARHRRQGNPVAAVEACQVGMDLIGTGPDQDGGRAFARLSLELVLALLDLDRRDDALRWASSVLDRPLRAPAAAAAGWLRYALAMRVYRPEGRVERAKTTLDTAADDARKHGLPALLSSALGALTELHELTDDSREALGTLRESQAATAEQRRTAARAKRLITAAYPADADATTQLLALLTDEPRRTHTARRAPGSGRLPDELTPLAAAPGAGPVDEAADRMTDFSSFGLPVPLNGGRHGQTGRDIAFPGRNRSEPAAREPSVPEPADTSADSSVGAFDAAWQALLGGTALSRPARRSGTWRGTRDDGTSAPRAGTNGLGTGEPGSYAGHSNQAGNSAGAEQNAPADDADSSTRPRGRGGVSELGLVISEGSGGRRRAPDEPDHEPPHQHADRSGAPATGSTAADAMPADAMPADTTDDRAWLDSIDYWPSRRDNDHKAAAAGGTGSAGHDTTRPATGPTRAPQPDDDREPAPPIPLRRPGRGRRNPTSASDMADLALGELLTEAMMAFHTGATQQPDAPEQEQPAADPEDRDRSSAHPGSAYPGTAHPGTAHPDAAHSGTAYPSSAYPDGAYSNGAYSGGAYSDGAYPDSAYPGSAYPSSARPASAQPASGYPDSSRQDGPRPDSPGPDSGRWGGVRPDQDDGRTGESRMSRRARREAAAAAYDSGSYESGSYDSGSYDTGSYDTGSYESPSFDSRSFDSGSGGYRSVGPPEPSPNEPYFDPLADIARYPDGSSDRADDPHRNRAPYEQGEDSAGRGAHAGGTRPGREWRLSDPPKYGY